MSSRKRSYTSYNAAAASILPTSQLIKKARKYQARKGLPLSMMRTPSTARSGGYSFRSQGGKELNFVDTNVNSTFSTTGQVVLLNGMAQGTSASTRIGRKILMKSLEWKFRLLVEAGATTNLIRYAIVVDHQSNGAAPAITDIYDSVNPTALRNISNKARFTVLYDSGLITMIGNTTTVAVGLEQLGSEGYKRINIPVQYNVGTAGTVGDIQTNGLFLITMGSTGAGSADANATGTLRVRYLD